ncbi:MAG: hypothetical protein IAE80_11410 [Anaerolinea sp.]|nr:hypothetical protein [Anaerolinea sp.]
MLRKLVFALLLLFVLALPLTLAAQSEIPLAEGYTIDFPSRWDWEDAGEYAGFYIYGDVYLIYIVDPVELSDLITIRSKDTLEDVLLDAYYALYEGDQPTAREIEELNVPGRTGAVWRYSIAADDIEGLFIVLEMSDGTVGILDIYADASNYDDPEQELEDVIVSFDATDASGGGADGGGGLGGSQEPAGESCTVSTDQARTVALRVGPGENRSSVAFLPTGVDVEVTGVALDNDGDEWFQLNKDQAAPQSAAAEIWMRRGDADESGDCDNVGETSAPPINPIAVQPPTAAPGATAAPPATGSITPVTGTYTVSYNANTNASCRGGGNVVIPTVEIVDDMAFNVYVVPVTGGINIGPDFFVRTSGTNSFIGSFTWDDGTNSQVYLTFSSSSFATGSEVFNFTINGTPCSGTFTFNMSR